MSPVTYIAHELIVTYLLSLRLESRSSIDVRNMAEAQYVTCSRSFRIMVFRESRVAHVAQ